MSYPFSIIGTIIFFIYGAVVLVVVVLPLQEWLLKGKSWKWWVIAPITLLFLAAPVAEELWIAHRFETLCQDAGVHVIRKVEADGYYDATKSDPSTEDKIIDEPEKVKRLKTHGYVFSEVRTLQGKVRHRRIRDEMIEQTILDEPTARYHLIHTHNHSKVGHQVTKMQRVIIDSQMKEMLGRDTKYARYPGWIEGLWTRFIGKGQVICRGENFGSTTLRDSLESFVFVKNRIK